ncbi:MAG: hypothetical protein IJF80_01460 [Clostridia bacterium]|nr:hypothetical protein [Clostridia bacterium]
MKASFNKVISILLMAVLALFAVSFALATADTELTLQVGDASFDTQSSSYVSVPVSVTQNEQGFIDMQFSIKFDENVFESINSVVIPSDSMLYYAQDAKNPDNKVKPTVIAGADNAKGLVRVVMSGVFQKNLSGSNEQYVFDGEGVMFNLRMKLREDVVSFTDASSNIEVIVSESADTPFVFRKSASQGSETALDKVASIPGTMSISTHYTAKTISIKTYDSVMFNADSVTPVEFTASPVCEGIYPDSDIKWYVNDVYTSSGAEFTYTAPSVNGTYCVCAKIQGAKSNEVIISVGGLTFPEAPAPIAGKQFVGYKAKLNGHYALFKAGSDFSGTANDLKEAEPVYITLSMEKGAAVKLSSPTGLRFTSKINLEEYEALLAVSGSSNFSVGTFIVPTDIVEEAGSFTIEEIDSSDDYVKVHRSNWYNETPDEEGFCTYTGVIWNIAKQNYNREFSAVAYVKVIYANGETAYFYSDYNAEDNSRSVAEVAYAAYTDTDFEYTDLQKTELKRFLDGTVNIAQDGTPLWENSQGYEPPYVSSLSDDGKLITVTARSGHIWLADEVCAVTYNGERIPMSQVKIRGAKLIITVE